MKKEEAEKRLRRLQAKGLGGSQEATQLLFSVEVTKHDERDINMQMNFQNPDSVSSGNQNDNMQMEVLEVSLFKSKSLAAMSKDSFENGDGRIDKSVPPILQDKDKAAQISATTEKGGDTMNGVTFTNFIASFLVGGSMQQLWGMIRTMQVVIL